MSAIPGVLTGDGPLIIDLPDEAATAALAEDVAARLKPGDVVALSGGLGAGKTTFARALLRALADDPGLDVPSPTFTLAQTYRAGRLAVTHFDLYRLASPDELDEIGFAEAAEDGAVLVEWPERAGDRLPATALDVAFVIAGAGRRAMVTGGEEILARFARSRAVRAFLDRSAWSGAQRRHLQGDASTRAYERIHDGARTAVLMDWPHHGQFAAGDPRAVFRAQDARAFVAVDEALRGAGLSAPEIYVADTVSGFLLMEDFGDDGIVVAGVPDAARYRVVVEALAAVHGQPRPSDLPLPDGSLHRLPPLVGDALMAEVGIFADSYMRHAAGAPLAGDARTEFWAIWSALAERLSHAERSWVLFDVQSPNLFWLPSRRAVARVGFIDFQDMFAGPAAYDVASLCFDARVDIPPALADELSTGYVARRRAADPSFDADSFREAFAIAAALRTIKNMGAFARLADAGKPIYLNHLQRLRGYLLRAVSHPVLSPLALWYERHLPS
ncbi:MAG: tRNA (adenosine(37)-N6)-threonylcarbamoyltransferase complex ATPase subunit type 1 TsaE [Bauldia sp.]